jgi:hypothetical protein
MFNFSLRKFRKLLLTPDLYFYDYFAKRINRKVDDSLPQDTLPTYRHRVAWGPVGRKVAAALGASLANLGVEHFWEHEPKRRGRRLHLRAESIPHLVSALVGLKAGTRCFKAAEESTICVSLPSGRLVPLPRLKSKQLLAAKRIRILCTEQSTTVPGAQVQTVSSIPVAFWDESASLNSSPIVAAKRRTKRVSRLRSETFSHYARHHVVIGEKKSTHIREVNFPIDVVYTWVNDKDPDWLRKKQQYWSAASSNSTEGRAYHPERFANRDELRFSLRSLEMFAPFVQHIYIVSDHQTPEWLNTKHPQISLVSHQEIFRDPSSLPTFNSHAIESQLHRISGLSEHFLYFNDDVFLGARCSPEDFFEANGIMRFYPSDQRLHLPDVDNTREEYLCANRNVARLLLRDHGVEATEIMLHTPHPCRRSFLTELEQRYPSEYAASARNKFRAPTDITSITFAQYHFGYLDRVAIPSKISHCYLALWKPHIAAQFRGVLQSRTYKTLCVNDTGVSADERVEKAHLVRDFLQSYFPFKSSFEL